MRGRYRYLVVIVVWVTMLVGAFDRSNVSLLLVDAGFLRDMGLEGSPERQGLVMTALLLPYALSNIFISPAADRWGPRKVLSAMVAVWSLAAVFIGSAASYPALLVARAGRGLGEGPLFPIANRFVRSWFPDQERGGANAIWNTGQRVGLALSVPILAGVIATFGWRASFAVQVALMLLLVLPSVWFLTADRPEEMGRVGKAELAHILAGRRERGTGPSAGSTHLRQLLANSSYWLAVIYHFSNLAIYAGLLTWLPKYLKDERAFDLGMVVLFATLPNVFSTITGLAFGFLSDRVGRRSLYCVTSLGAASAAVCLASLVSDPVASALLMVAAFAFWGIGAPAYYVIMQRLIPGRLMATGIGIDNGISNLGSAMAPVTVGLLVAGTGSYVSGLLFLSAMGFLGTISAGLLAARGY